MEWTPPSQAAKQTLVTTGGSMDDGCQAADLIEVYEAPIVALELLVELAAHQARFAFRGGPWSVVEMPQSPATPVKRLPLGAAKRQLHGHDGHHRITGAPTS
jgi:hypothetical protein